MKQDDLLWKAVLEDVFDDTLLFFFKERAGVFDLEKGFEFLDKELDQLFPERGTTGNMRYVDKLVKVFTKQGEEKWLLVHVEVQGYNDPGFAKRMFTYFYRILDKYDKLVTCIAIFTGDNRRYMTGEYHYEFMGVENTFKYNTYRIIDQDADELRKSDNPFALVILTALIALQKGKKLEDELVPMKIDILRALAQKAIPRKKIRGIMNFLKHYVKFEKPENNIKFEEAIIAVTGKNTANMGTEEYLLLKFQKEGMEEGLEKGLEKGLEMGREEAAQEKNVAFVKSLLSNTDFDDEKIASLVGVNVAFVKEIKTLL